MKNIKVGDVVHVRFEVATITKDGKEALIRGSERNSGSYVPIEWIVHVEPRPLKVGDKVIFERFNGVILAIDNSIAWIKFKDGSYGNKYLNALDLDND